MGASKVLSVLLRVWELICSTIVLGIIGSFFSRVSEANGHADNHLVFAIVVASISLVISLLFMLPFTFTFMACPLDFIFFALWLTSFILLDVLTGTSMCNAVWYYNYWGYYWGWFWRTPIIVTGPWDINWSGCSAWRTVLAFSFMASMGFLVSSILGVYVVIKYREEKKEAARRLYRHEHEPKPVDGMGRREDDHMTPPASV